MPAFLEDISRFRGNEGKNEAGQTLEEFLDVYDPYKYKTPSVTTDAVIFAYQGERCESVSNLKILLVKRSNHPCIGFWALPGGFANMRENLEVTARRELEEETGVSGLCMEQIATYGDYDRDPRTRVITTVYMALVREEEVKVSAGDDAADAVWCEIDLEHLTEEQEEDFTVNRYRLKVQNKSRDLDTEALVEQRVRGDLIREEYYRVISGGQIGMDHSAIIVQCLIQLKKRL